MVGTAQLERLFVKFDGFIELGICTMNLTVDELCGGEVEERSSTTSRVETTFL